MKGIGKIVASVLLATFLSVSAFANTGTKYEFTADLTNLTGLPRPASGWPPVRLISRGIGGGSIIREGFGLPRTLQPVGDTITIDLLPSEDYDRKQEYVLVVGTTLFPFIMPDAPASYASTQTRIGEVGVCTVSPSAPVSASPGDLWCEKDDAENPTKYKFHYRADNAWQEIGASGGGSLSGADRLKLEDSIPLGGVEYDGDGNDLTLRDHSGDTRSVELFDGECSAVEGTGATGQVLKYKEAGSENKPVCEWAADNTSAGGTGLDAAGVRAQTTEQLNAGDNVSITSAGSGAGQTLTIASEHQTASEIKTAYESNSDTNAYTNMDRVKVGRLPTSACPNGQILKSNGNTFACQDDATSSGGGDITGVAAGAGLTGGGTSGDVSLRVNLDGTTLDTSASGIKVSDEGIDTNQIADDAVATAKVADNQITEIKLSSAVRTKLNDTVPNAVELDTDGFTASDNGDFPTWNNSGSNWDSGTIISTDDLEAEYNVGNATWSIKPKEKLGEIINVFRDGGWDNVSGGASAVPFLTDSSRTEPTSITGHTFKLVGTNPTAFSDANWLVVRMPIGLEFKTERYRIALDIDNPSDVDYTYMNDSTQVSMLGTDTNYDYFKVGVIPGIGGSEKFTMQVLSEFTIDPSRVDIATREYVDAHSTAHISRVRFATPNLNNLNNTTGASNDIIPAALALFDPPGSASVWDLDDADKQNGSFRLRATLLLDNSSSANSGFVEGAVNQAGGDKVVLVNADFDAAQVRAVGNFVSNTNPNNLVGLEVFEQEVWNASTEAGEYRILVGHNSDNEIGIIHFYDGESGSETFRLSLINATITWVPLTEIATTDNRFSHSDSLSSNLDVALPAPRNDSAETGLSWLAWQDLATITIASGQSGRVLLIGEGSIEIIADSGGVVSGGGGDRFMSEFRIIQTRSGSDEVIARVRTYGPRNLIFNADNTGADYAVATRKAIVSLSAFDDVQAADIFKLQGRTVSQRTSGNTPNVRFGSGENMLELESL